MKTYKAFNKDMTCRDFQYAEGQEYEMEGPIRACERGFHAFDSLIQRHVLYGASDLSRWYRPSWLSTLPGLSHLSFIAVEGL